LAHKQHNVTRRTEPLIADDRCYEGLLEREDNLLPPQLEVDAEPPTGLEGLVRRRLAHGQDRARARSKTLKECKELVRERVVLQGGASGQRQARAGGSESRKGV
jgi:hypothetical protein